MRRALFFLGILVATLFFGISLVIAQTDYGLGETATAAGIPSSRNITQIIGDVIGTALSLVSVLFFALMLYAGIKWMLARGDSGEAESALGTIIHAIIGLIVVLASYAITNFVFNTVGAPGGGGGEEKDVPDAENAECVAQGTGYDCRSSSLCETNTIKTNLCPGGASNVCCKVKTTSDVYCINIDNLCVNKTGATCIFGESNNWTFEECAVEAAKNEDE